MNVLKKKKFSPIINANSGTWEFEEIDKFYSGDTNMGELKGDLSCDTALIFQVEKNIFYICILKEIYFKNIVRQSFLCPSAYMVLIDWNAVLF